MWLYYTVITPLLAISRWSKHEPTVIKCQTGAVSICIILLPHMSIGITCKIYFVWNVLDDLWIIVCYLVFYNTLRHRYNNLEIRCLQLCKIYSLYYMIYKLCIIMVFSYFRLVQWSKCRCPAVTMMWWWTKISETMSVWFGMINRFSRLNRGGSRVIEFA